MTAPARSSKGGRSTARRFTTNKDITHVPMIVGGMDKQRKLVEVRGEERAERACSCDSSSPVQKTVSHLCWLANFGSTTVFHGVFGICHCPLPQL